MVKVTTAITSPLFLNVFLFCHFIVPSKILSIISGNSFDELIWKNPKCDPLVDQLLQQKKSLSAALFFLFCIAPNEEAALKLANSQTLSTLISISEQRIQRIHVLTALCLHESFCTETTYMNGIINFAIKSISINKSSGASI